MVETTMGTVETEVTAELWSGERIRLLRGRALLKLDDSELAAGHMSDGGVWIPGTSFGERKMKIHRGTVVALGPPARTKGRRGKLGAETPWDVEPGDEVLFVYAEWLERMRRFEGFAVVSQSEIVGVIEC